MKLKEVLDRTVQFFKDKKIETARLDAELLIAHGLKLKQRIDLYLKFDQPLSEAELAECRELVRRRSQGEPVAYILQKKGFMHWDFYVDSRVLIPRPETELLVEEVIQWAQLQNLTKLKILDLGTGSGCVGLSLLKQFPESELWAVDASAGAIEVARRNAVDLGVGERVHFIQGDAGDIDSIKRKVGTTISFDAIVSNPPYIDEKDAHVEEMVRKFEPAQALFALDEGFRDLKDWSTGYAPLMCLRSMMVFEMGSRQADIMKSHFKNINLFSKIYTVKDLSGYERHIVGVKNG